MFGLQKLFDKQVEEQFRPNKLGVRILENGLEDIGIFITDSQRTDFENQFLKIDSGTLSFNFSDEQLNKAGFSSEDELEPKVRELVEGLSSKIEKFSSNIDETMQGLVDDVTDSMAESILQTLEERMDDMLDDQVSIQHGFTYNIESIWGEPLGLLQGLIVIADESAQRYSSRTDEYLEGELVQDLLIRIHAKAVQVTKEIFTLLRNGFSDGAQARWRTLHELAVISVFISEHGEDLAERYVSHETIDTYKAAAQYNDYYPRLGAEPISEEEMELMREDYQRLLEQYGQSYKHDYGWAAGALAIKRPTFRDIEASVDLDHHRPYYKAASANVHGNPTGVLQSLGLFPEEDIVLSGPSDIGLTRPAQSTVISLNTITTTMLTHGANVDSIVVSKAIAKYGSRVEDAFIAIETEISSSVGV